MSQEDTTMLVHPAVLELAELLRPDWPVIDGRLRASGVPLCEGDPADEQSDEPAGTGGDDDEDSEPQSFDREYVERLRRENASYRTRAQEAESKVQTFEQRDMTEQQRLEQRATEAESKIPTLESDNLRLRVALKKGLVGDKAILADRLRGTTEAELEADADELLQHFGGAGGTSFDGGARGGSNGGGHQAPQDMDSALRAAAGRA